MRCEYKEFLVLLNNVFTICVFVLFGLILLYSVYLAREWQKTIDPVREFKEF